MPSSSFVHFLFLKFKIRIIRTLNKERHPITFFFTKQFTHKKPALCRFLFKIMSLHELKTNSTFFVSVAHVAVAYMSLEVWFSFKKRCFRYSIPNPGSLPAVQSFHISIDSMVLWAILVSNKSRLLRNSMIDVSSNHLELHISSKRARAS